MFEPVGRQREIPGLGIGGIVRAGEASETQSRALHRGQKGLPLPITASFDRFPELAQGSTLVERWTRGFSRWGIKVSIALQAQPLRDAVGT